MIVNARMYSVNAAAKAAWRELLAWVLGRASISWQIIDYDAPAPLAALWVRDDLACGPMCGLPYSLRVPEPVLIAAPELAAARACLLLAGFEFSATADYALLRDRHDALIATPEVW